TPAHEIWFESSGSTAIKWEYQPWTLLSTSWSFVQLPPKLVDFQMDPTLALLSPVYVPMLAKTSSGFWALDASRALPENTVGLTSTELVPPSVVLKISGPAPKLPHEKRILFVSVGSIRMSSPMMTLTMEVQVAPASVVLKRPSVAAAQTVFVLR